MDLKNSIKYFLPTLFFLFILCGCSVDPITGKNTLNLYSESSEQQIGEEQHPLIVQQYGEYNDPTLVRYVQNIVSRIGDVSHRPQLDYQVTVLNTPMINAFALPGGHVYVCRGLLPYLNSEAELAGVMAHEIGHVTARHGVERLSQSSAINLGLILGGLFIFKEEKQASQFYDIGSGISTLGLLSYSRENEMEADRLGVDYADKAGFSPLGVEQTMKMFERMSGGADNPLFTILSTHPASDIRAKQARIEVRKLAEKKEINRDLGRKKYLQTISNLLLGNDPQRGVIHGRTYYNSTYRFKMVLSHDYKSALEEPDYMLVLKDESSAETIYYRMLSPEENEPSRKQELETKLKIQPVRTASFSWNKYQGTAYIYLIKDSNDQPAYQLTHYFSRFLQNTLEIIILEKRNSDSTNIDTLNELMANTQELTDAELQRLENMVKRLQIYVVQPGDTWQSITEKYFKGEDPQRLAWLNGCELTDPLPAEIKLSLF